MLLPLLFLLYVWLFFEIFRNPNREPLVDPEKQIINRIFSLIPPPPKPSKQQISDDFYLANHRKRDYRCADEFRGCPRWARNGECKINPEYMLYHCPGSCGTCRMSADEKFRLTEIYNRQTLPHCVVHEPYPYPESYILDMLESHAY